MPGKNYQKYQAFEDHYQFVAEMSRSVYANPQDADERKNNLDFLAALIQRPEGKVVFEDGSTVDNELLKREYEKNPLNLRRMLDAHMENGRVNFAVLYNEGSTGPYDEDEPTQNKRVFALEMTNDGGLRGQLVNTPEEYMDAFPRGNAPQKPGFLDYLVHIFKYLFGGDEVVNRYNSYMYDRARNVGMEMEEPKNYVSTQKEPDPFNNIRMQGIRFTTGTQYTNAMPQDEIVKEEEDRNYLYGTQYVKEYPYVPFRGSEEAKKKVQMIEQDAETKRRKIQDKAFEVQFRTEEAIEEKMDALGGEQGSVEVENQRKELRRQLNAEKEKSAEFRHFLDLLTLEEQKNYSKDPERKMNEHTFAVTNVLSNMEPDKFRKLRAYFDKNGMAKTEHALTEKLHPEKDILKNPFRRKENVEEKDNTLDI